MLFVEGSHSRSRQSNKVNAIKKVSEKKFNLQKNVEFFNSNTRHKKNAWHIWWLWICVVYVYVKFHFLARIPFGSGSYDFLFSIQCVHAHNVEPNKWHLTSCNTSNDELWTHFFSKPFGYKKTTNKKSH